MALARAVVLRVEQVRDPLAQELRAPAEDARDRLVQRRADEREHEVDEDQADRDVERRKVEHQAAPLSACQVFGPTFPVGWILCVRWNFLTASVVVASK